MEEFKDVTLCPFCGSSMIWDSDARSEECGYDQEGKIVMFFHCPECGATGEFCEKSED